MTAPVRPVLTALQQQVLEWIADGSTRAEIGERLHYSPTGATGIVDRLYAKLGAENAPHAVLLACRAGLLDGRPLLRHGDHAGYEAHRKRRIPSCDACIEGEKAYRADLKARQEAQEAA